MSNESIAKRILEVCDDYIEKKISILELGQSIPPHGTALENMDKDWEEIITVFDGECETIDMDYFPKHQYEQGIILVKILKEAIYKRFPTLKNAKKPNK